MSAETTIFDLLRGNAPLLALLDDEERIYPQIIFAPADGTLPALPAVIYSLGETEEVNGLEGVTLITRHRFVLQAWSKTRDEADAVLAACKTALIGAGIPSETRASTFDTDVGLHASSLEFDHWA